MTTLLLAVHPLQAGPNWADELAAVPGWTVRGPAHSLAQVRQQLAGGPPSLLVADLRLQDGDLLHLMRLLQASHPTLRVPVLVLTPPQADPLLLDVLQAGADSFHTTTPHRPGALAEQVRASLAGGAEIAPWIARRLLDHFQAKLRGPAREIVEDLVNPLSLTQDECALLRQLSAGARVSELARREGVVPRELTSRLRGICRKMQWALRAGDLRLA